MKKDRIQVPIVLLNSEDSIDYDFFIELDYYHLNQHTLIPIRFLDKIEEKFSDVRKEEGHIDLKDKGKDFRIYMHDKEELIALQSADIYGEEGLLKMLTIAKENKWQIFIMGLGKIDLDFPEKYTFEEYKKFLLKTNE